MPAGPLPLVVHVGFAGSRQLLAKAADAEAVARFEARVAAGLEDRLRRLAGELGLGEERPPCGVSQVAIGADLAFTRALQRLGWPQRVYLAQPRDAFLAATGSDGAPDFPDGTRHEAERLLASPHVIQERVVSTAASRAERFLDANVAIARTCDVAVCLFRAEASPKPGGTQDFLARALARGKPVLEVRVAEGPGGEPRFEETWHQRERWQAPSLPHDLTDVPYPAPPADGASGTPGPPARTLGLPPLAAYGDALKRSVSLKARQHQSRFLRSAQVILGAHLLATLVSLVALGNHHLHDYPLLASLISAELALLALGLWVHVGLHRSHRARAWAFSRLAAEIARSVLAMGGVHAQLKHLFGLPLPISLRALTKTLNVLHLQDSRARAGPWEQRRDGYVVQRLTDPERGQIAYYTRKGSAAGRTVRWMERAFLVCSLGAVVVSAVEIGLSLRQVPGPPLLGIAAVMLPLLAVAALSFSAAFDLEARTHVYGEMAELLEGQARRLALAASEREFDDLALETESLLLGETANWFARQSFRGVA